MSLLSAQGVDVAYVPARGQRIWSVRDVDLDLDEGEFVGLVGESGCGKSTLGYALTRMLRPPARLESGRIMFDDTDIASLSGEELRQQRRNGFALVLQSGMNALNPLHTVEYTLTRPCQNFLGLSAREAKARVDELLETVGLTPAEQFAPKLPHQLSGGQRQRVVIARALACGPDLIVADEPVSMLDVSLRAGVLKLLARLRVERGLSLLYITHDLLSARVVTDEILVLHHGRIVERGVTKDVLQHPKDDYTVELLDAIANPYADVPSDAPADPAVAQTTVGQ